MFLFSASLPTPVKVRVGYNLKYHVYLSTAVKNTFKLQFNFTNDVSESVFIYLQHQATLYELTGTNTKGKITNPLIRTYHKSYSNISLTKILKKISLLVKVTQ